MRLDAESVKWPLFFRFWKDGDRFYPLGLGGSKKLQDFFVDSKVPGRERRRVPLLCDQEKICWVVGYRLDDRVKVTPQTTTYLAYREIRFNLNSTFTRPYREAHREWVAVFP